MQPRYWMPVSSLLYAATFWGLVWYPLRLLEQLGLSGVWQTLVSYTAALVVVLPLLRRREPWRAHRADLAALALAAGWCNLAFILAMLDGQVMRVLLLFYLSPVWAVLFGRWLLGERLSRRSAALLAVALTGAVLMLWRPELRRPWPADPADWLALSAGVGFALSNVMVRRLRAVSIAGKTFSAWIGAVLVSLLALLFLDLPFPDVEVRAWSGAVMVGLGGFFFATFALQFGVTHMPVQRSSVVLLFEIVVGAVSAALLAGEWLSGREWAGGVLIVVAGYAMVRHGGGQR